MSEEKESGHKISVEQTESVASEDMQRNLDVLDEQAKSVKTTISPDYSISHRRHVDYQQYTTSPDTSDVQVNVFLPTFFAYRVNVSQFTFPFLFVGRGDASGRARPHHLLTHDEVEC